MVTAGETLDVHRPLLVLALVSGAFVPAAQAAYCVTGAELSLDCAIEQDGIEITLYRDDEVHYVALVQACLAAPGDLVVQWSVPLAEGDPVGVAIVPSAPTGDPACPHLAVYQAGVAFGTFDPFYVCGQMTASTPEGVATKVVCEHD